MSDEGDRDECYSLGELLGQFGDRWSIKSRRYLDGDQLTAVPRPLVQPFIPIVRETPAAMRDALEAEEAAQRR